MLNNPSASFDSMRVLNARVATEQGDERVGFMADLGKRRSLVSRETVKQDQGRCAWTTEGA